MRTMDCAQCKDKIWDYIEGTLTETEQKEMKKHLEECENCAAEAREISVIMEGLHGLPLEDVPEDYHTELMAKLEQEVVPFKKKTANRWKPYYLIAAAVLVVAAVGGVGGIQNFQGNILTVEKQSVTQQKQVEESKTELTREREPIVKEKKESATQTKTAQSLSTPQKDIVPQQQRQPVKEKSSPQMATSHNTLGQPKVIQQQKQVDSPIQAGTEPQPVTTNTMDTPMPMHLRMESDEQIVQTVVLTVQDTKVALEQLHQTGEALAIWEENAGADFIVFSMQAEQTEAFYQKLKELGEVELPKKTVVSEEPVFIKVAVKSK